MRLGIKEIRNYKKKKKKKKKRNRWVLKKRKDKKKNLVLREVSKWPKKCLFLFFFFKKFFLDKFILKTWISRRVSYFVAILSGVGDIFLPDYPQVLSLLNVRSRGISKPHKSSVQREESTLSLSLSLSIYIYIYIFFFLFVEWQDNCQNKT